MIDLATATHPTAPRTAYERAIVYVPETRDYACYLDNELVFFARNYHEAEVSLDELIDELRKS